MDKNKKSDNSIIKDLIAKDLRRSALLIFISVAIIVIIKRLCG